VVDRGICRNHGDENPCRIRRLLANLIALEQVLTVHAREPSSLPRHRRAPPDLKTFDVVGEPVVPIGHLQEIAARNGVLERIRDRAQLVCFGSPTFDLGKYSAHVEPASPRLGGSARDPF